MIEREDMSEREREKRRQRERETEIFFFNVVLIFFDL
jgi:hypothetical protein